MKYPLHITTITLQHKKINLLVPDDESVKAEYLFQQQQNKATPFPYWAKIWPSSLAMANFILEQPALIENKIVLELAAGMGLPSFIATAYASEVCCSDYLHEATEIIQNNINYHKFKNITTRIIDWNNIPTDIHTDVLLLSDVNYEPDEFEKLYEVICRFLEYGVTIIITTPQRLMAKSFIEKLLPFCVLQEESDIQLINETVIISIMVLKK